MGFIDWNIPNQWCNEKKTFFLKNVGLWVGQKAPKKIFPVSYVVMNYSLISPGSGSTVYTNSIQSSRIWIFAPKMVDIVFHILSTIRYQGPVPILARKFKAKKVTHWRNYRVGNWNKLFKTSSSTCLASLINAWLNFGSLNSCSQGWIYMFHL